MERHGYQAGRLKLFGHSSLSTPTSGLNLGRVLKTRLLLNWTTPGPRKPLGPGLGVDSIGR